MKSELALGAVPPSATRSTRTRPAGCSATNRSPLGATRSRLGPSRPVANTATLKPSGALGRAPGGGGTTLDWAATPGVANGAGRSATVILCFTPGASAL